MTAARTFTRDGYSFRPVSPTRPGPVGWNVYEQGMRSHWSQRASLWPSSDGQAYIITMNGYAIDARTSLEGAVALVLERLAAKP